MCVLGTLTLQGSHEKKLRCENSGNVCFDCHPFRILCWDSCASRVHHFQPIGMTCCATFCGLSVCPIALAHRAHFDFVRETADEARHFDTDFVPREREIFSRDHKLSQDLVLVKVFLSSYNDPHKAYCTSSLTGHHTEFLAIFEDPVERDLAKGSCTSSHGSCPEIVYESFFES